MLKKKILQICSREIVSNGEREQIERGREGGCESDGWISIKHVPIGMEEKYIFLNINNCRYYINSTFYTICR